MQRKAKKTGKPQIFFFFCKKKGQMRDILYFASNSLRSYATNYIRKKAPSHVIKREGKKKKRAMQKKKSNKKNEKEKK